MSVLLPRLDACNHPCVCHVLCASELHIWRSRPVCVCVCSRSTKIERKIFRPAALAIAQSRSRSRKHSHRSLLHFGRSNTHTHTLAYHRLSIANNTAHALIAWTAVVVAITPQTNPPATADRLTILIQMWCACNPSVVKTKRTYKSIHKARCGSTIVCLCVSVCVLLFVFNSVLGINNSTYQRWAAVTTDAPHTNTLIGWGGGVIWAAYVVCLRVYSRVNV